ncbi:MAG: hypothetical protein AAGF11_54920 [Myxococcota bacterium]
MTSGRSRGVERVTLGQSNGRTIVLEELGAGAMGAVLEAYD